MFKSGLVVLVGTLLAGCSTTGESVIDFGPEPGTAGDESYWHYQPQIHGPGAPRDITQARPAAEPPVAEPASAEPTVAPAAAATAPAPAATTTPAARPAVAAPAPAATPVLPAPPPESTPPAAPTSESMFNDAIRRAVATGDVDRALKLLEEAERLGSRSARPTFIEAVKSGGQ